ncbi:MAG: hypothetical protein AB7H77_03620 [Bdellovibrionales bacterium]
MSEKQENAASETSAPTTINLKILTEMFLDNSFENPIKHIASMEPYKLADAYWSAAIEAKKENDSNSYDLYSALAQLLNLHLRPTDRANVWGAHTGYWEGRRSLIPSDLKGEQNETLYGAIEKVENPILKARIADIVWSNDKKKWKAAIAAVTSYCTLVREILEGILIPEFTDAGYALVEAVDYAQRGLQISHSISKKGKLASEITEALKDLYEEAKRKKVGVAIRRSAELGCYYGIFDQENTARDLELVAPDTDGTNPLVAGEIYDYASRIYRELKQDDNCRRCKLKAIEQTLKMRKQVSTPAAEAYWVTEALLQLRQLPNTHDEQRILEDELRLLQRASTLQMVSVPLNLDLAPSREAIYNKFKTFDLATALQGFASIDIPRDIDALKKDALKTARENPISAMFAVSHIDMKGRPVNKTSGAPAFGEPDQDWYDTTINRAQKLYRHITVAAGIEPARLAINENYSITEEVIAPIIHATPFVPMPLKQILILGCTRFLQGDFISATFLIIPQIEAILRHTLEIHGFDPSKRRDDATEEDLALSSIFLNFRPQIEKIFTPTLAYHLELIFEKNTGPGLRHAVAHAKIGSAGCYDPDVIYACWLLFHIFYRSIEPIWDDQIAPAIGIMA